MTVAVRAPTTRTAGREAKEGGRDHRAAGHRRAGHQLLWWVRALMLLLGLSWALALVPLQAAAFATITPAATGAASTLFNTGRQLGMAVGVAILTTVASAVGLTQKATGRAVAPHLAAYHAGLVTASVTALIEPASRSWWTTAPPPRRCTAPSHLAATPQPPPTPPQGGCNGDHHGPGDRTRAHSAGRTQSPLPSASTT